MKQILNRLFNHQSLTREESAEVMRKYWSGMYNESQIPLLFRYI
jgi:anthranilate phosphoribosyltransferase